MKISELTGVKKLRTYGAGKMVSDMVPTVNGFAEHNNWLNFIDELERLGFNLLGKGKFGVAFEKPGYPWVIKIFKKDAAYMSYLEYAISHQQYSAVPKIKGKFIPINREMGIFAVRLEKLYKIDVKQHHDLITLLYRIKYRTPREDNAMVLDAIATIDTTVGQVLQTMPWHGVIDIHEENIMQRADGSLVIIDPLAFL